MSNKTNTDGFSCYVHIPYCIQKCAYCDFAVFTPDKLPPPSKYMGWLKQEVAHRHQGLPSHHLNTLYFGGGTPSLIPTVEIAQFIKYLKQYFVFAKDIEISLEINPGTITKESLNIYQSAGVNRFSLGVQTFREDLLKLFKREHSAKDSKQSLKLLRESGDLFSVDLLFALPGQSEKDLKKDIDELLDFQPHHVSTYCLTLPPRHFLQVGRPSELAQTKMFRIIRERLLAEGFEHYEISNFARTLRGSHSPSPYSSVVAEQKKGLPPHNSNLAGQKSYKNDPFHKSLRGRHNLAYWLDQNYWGLGLSAHSFLKVGGKRWRFWNTKNLKMYRQSTKAKPFRPYPFSGLPEEQKECLSLEESLTDFCLTALRTSLGLSEDQLKQTFGTPALNRVLKVLHHLEQKKSVEYTEGVWTLPFSSWLISDFIFQDLTFS